jgi:hypothetical protein
MNLRSAILALAFPLLGLAQESEPLTAAVLDFQTTGERLAGKGAEAAALLSTKLSISGDVMLWNVRRSKRCWAKWSWAWGSRQPGDRCQSR